MGDRGFRLIGVPWSGLQACRWMAVPVRRRSKMTKVALRVPAAAVFALIFALASAEVAAQGIPVTPADPTIAVGQTMQFTATGVDTARAIEAGSFHQCAVLEDTTLRCWGENDYGQLGNGVISSPPETPNPTPVAVVGVTGALAARGRCRLPRTLL